VNVSIECYLPDEAKAVSSLLGLALRSTLAFTRYCFTSNFKALLCESIILLWLMALPPLLQSAKRTLL